MTPDRVRGDGGALIITAVLPGEIKALAERLRQAHYPSERNRVAAHVTLFRTLPPSCEAELADVLAAAGRDRPPVRARLDGVMSLGQGTALKISSADMLELRRELAELFRGLLTTQDEHTPRLHVTIQNKVSEREARALQAELAPTLAPRDFRFPGLALHRYRGGPWEAVKRWSFRG